MISASSVKFWIGIRYLLSSGVEAFTAALPAFFLALFEEGADILVMTATLCLHFCTASISQVVNFEVPDL